MLLIVMAFSFIVLALPVNAQTTIPEIQEMTISGESEFIFPVTEDCLGNKRCKFITSGIAESDFGQGVFTAVTTIFYAHSYSNYKNGFCYTFIGNGTFRTLNQGRIKIRIQGQVCDVAEASFENDFEFNGNFIINNSNRDFRDVRGYGVFEGYIDRTNQIFDFELQTTPNKPEPEPVIIDTEDEVV